MKLLVGLGNPGRQYENSRHNLGFYILDEIARHYQAEFKDAPKYHGHLASFELDNQKVYLLKPSTYYNEVGRSARALSDFYKIKPEDTLIIHDELALPFGRIRTRVGGSDAGNNGIKSLNSYLGEHTKRLRIGIYNPQRDQMDDASFVLAKFSLDESKQLAEITNNSIIVTNNFLKDIFTTETIDTIINESP